MELSDLYPYCKRAVDNLVAIIFPTHYDAGVNKGHPSRCCVRNTKKNRVLTKGYESTKTDDYCIANANIRSCWMC